LKPDMPFPPTRDHSASPDLLNHVVSLIIERRPQFVLELGSGSSTVFLAYALKRSGGGRLVSIDHDSAFARRTRSMLERHGLSEVGTVIHRPLAPVRIDDIEYVWYDTGDLEIGSTIDMMLVDGPPYHVHPLARYPALRLLSPFFSDDIVIVLDDADRPEELRIATMWKKEFSAFSTERLETEKGALLLRRSGALATDSARGEVR
jgi:predicted O-methyltransferase YrrM